MNLNRMAVFAAVVEQGTFTAAAQVVGLTKSMVSQHVSALEDELGVRLMQRTTRSLMLTEAGEVYYRGCQKVAEEASALAVRLQSLKHEPAGKLRSCVRASKRCCAASRRPMNCVARPKAKCRTSSRRRSRCTRIACRTR